MSAATAKHAYAPLLTAAPSSKPEAVALGGPTRSGPSPPRLASAASLCRLVPSWINMLPISAAETAGQRSGPSTAQASAAPTTTGVVERLRVRGRAAKIHDDSFMRRVDITSVSARSNLQHHYTKRLRPERPFSFTPSRSP